MRRSVESPTVAIDDLRDDWRYTSLLVSGGHFMSHFHFLAFPPLFPLLKSDLGITNAQAGLIVSIIAVATFLQAPLGAVVDRVGGKQVLVVGLTLTSLGVGLAGLAPSFPVLLLFVLVSGVGQATFHPSDYALLNAATVEKKKGRAFSLHAFAGFLGFAASPLVIGTMGVRYGWQPALLVAGALGLVYALLVVLALPAVYLEAIQDDAMAVEDGGRDDLRRSIGIDRESFVAGLRELLRPAVLTVFLFFVGLTVAENGVRTFTSVLVVDSFGLPTAAANTTLTMFFALAAIGILVGGVLADRFRAHRIIVVALAVAAVLTWIAVSGLLPVTELATVSVFSAMGFTVGTVFPSRDRLVSATSSAGSAGKSFGFVFSGQSLADLVGPVVLGYVIDTAGAGPAFVVIGGAFLVTAMFALVAAPEG